MMEVTFTIEADRGYFDYGEVLMWDADIWLRAIHGIEFLSDGSVSIVYAVEGDVDMLAAAIDDAKARSLEYSITRASEPTLIKIQFFPDDVLEEIFEIQRSIGVSLQYPLEYVGYDPTVIEVTEIGSREEIRRRIQRTREIATVEVRQLQPYRPDTGGLFQDLTDRQQQVLLTAYELGYYRTPREATHEDIAGELSCSPSVVGQHLRRIERELVSVTVPDHLQPENEPRAVSD